MSTLSPVSIASAAAAAPSSALAATGDVVLRRVVAAAAPSATFISGDSSVASVQSASGPSSAFLAQAISQSEAEQADEQIALAASSFARFAPALQYTALAGYSVVKYRPSDAGLPTSTEAATPAQQSEKAAQAATALSDYRAYDATQSRNSSNLAASVLQLSVAG